MYTKSDVGKKVIAMHEGPERAILTQYTIKRVSLDGKYVELQHGNLTPTEFKSEHTAHDIPTLSALLDSFKGDADCFDVAGSNDFNFCIDKVTMTVDKYGDKHYKTVYHDYVLAAGTSYGIHTQYQNIYTDMDKLKETIRKFFPDVFTPDYQLRYDGQDCCPHCGSRDIEFQESCSEEMPEVYYEYFKCYVCGCPIVQKFSVKFESKDIDKDML